MNLHENILRIKEMMGIKENERQVFDFSELVDKGVLVVTEPYMDGEKVPANWEGDSNVITLWNLKNPEKGQEWVYDAVKNPKPEAIDFWTNKGQFTLSDEKYQQILRSIEMLNPQKNQMDESMNVDDWGRLHDEDSKIVYPYKKIAKFLDWYEQEWGQYAKEQGWFIVTSDTDVPKVKYKPEEGNKYNLFFQVQRIDDPMEGEAKFGRLKSDMVADELAKKTGLMLDEYGVVIGWNGESFL
jgi:hypothetical protein